MVLFVCFFLGGGARVGRFVFRSCFFVFFFCLRGCVCIHVLLLDVVCVLFACVLICFCLVMFAVVCVCLVVFTVMCVCLFLYVCVFWGLFVCYLRVFQRVAV